MEKGEEKYVISSPVRRIREVSPTEKLGGGLPQLALLIVARPSAVVKALQGMQLHPPPLPTLPATEQGTA